MTWGWLLWLPFSPAKPVQASASSLPSPKATGAAPPSSVLAPGFVYLVLEVTVTTVSDVFVAYLLYVKGHVGDVSVVDLTFKLH